MSNYRRLYLFACSEDGFSIVFGARINRKGMVAIENLGTNILRKRKKAYMRHRDRNWVIRNIPSSIW